MEIVVLIVGLVFFAAGVFLVIEHKNFKERAYKVRGTVVAIERYTSTTGSGRDRRTSTFYRPVVEYVAHGQTYRINNTGGRERIRHRLRQTVPVLVAHENPANARLQNSANSIVGPIFAAVGLVMIVLFGFIYEFSWLSVGVGALLLGGMALFARRIYRRTGVGSFEEFKQQFRDLNAAGKPAGSPEDPLLRMSSDSDSVLFRTRAELRKERQRIALIERIILLFFLAIGIGMLWFGWGIYEEEMASAHPDWKRAYVLLGMGALFVLGVLPGLIRSSRS